MNHRSDIDRVMEVWMADGPTAIPDRVVDVVAARIGVQRQRRAWPFQRRLPMNPLFKLGAAAAAVLVVAVIGYSLLPKQPGVGGHTPVPSATATPAPTAAVTAAPSAGAKFPSWYTGGGNGAGILSAGSQTTRSFSPGFTFTVPEGWVNGGDEAGFYGLFPDTPANQAEFGRSEGLAQEIVMGPQNSPYFTCDAWEDNQGATAAEIVAAMVANEALATSEPVDVTIGGLTGKQVDVRLDPAWTETCPGDPETLDLGDMRTRGFLLDRPEGGVIVIFVGSLHSVGHEAFLAEAMPIVTSFQFNLGQ